MIKNQSNSDNRGLDSFNLEHFKMRRFNLMVNGVQVPSQKFEFDYSNSENVQSSRGCKMIYRSSGITNIMIGVLQLPRKCFILAFDLTADQSNTTICSNLMSQDIIRIEGRFSEPHREAGSCLIYCEYHRNI